MKKNSVFKVLGITVLVAALLTWILKSSYYEGGLVFGERFQVGILDVFKYSINSFAFFPNIFIYILVVGGFYGILNATGVYKKLISGLAEGFKKKPWLFLVITMCILALISSVIGLDFGLIIAFPFLISVILEMGYDKITAIAATAGATIIGLYGATFSSNMFQVNNAVLSLEYVSEIWMKIILFVLGLGLLILFTLKRAKKCVVNTKKDDDNKKTVKEVIKEVKKSDKSEQKNDDKSKKIWPLIVVIDVVLLVMLLGTLPWEQVFKIEFFANIYDKIMAFKIGGFPIIAKIVSATNFAGSTSIGAFGTWSFDNYTILLLIASVVLAFIYRIKISNFLESFGNGVKEMLLPAVVTMLVYVVLIITVYNPVILTIMNFILNLSKGFNVITSSLAFMIGSIFNVDMYYFSYNTMYYLTSVFTEPELYPLINVMSTNLYGLMMLLAPTSAILILSLAYTKTSYIDWIKFVWKIFLSLLIVSLIIFIIVLLI